MTRLWASRASEVSRGVAPQRAVNSRGALRQPVRWAGRSNPLKRDGPAALIASLARTKASPREGATAPALACAAKRTASSAAEQGLGLVHAFLLLGGRIGIVDNSRARLHMHSPVLHDGGAQHDAGIHLAARTEIADAAGIGAALLLLQLVDDLHRPHLRSAGDGSSGKPARGHRAGRALVEVALDVRHDVHDVAVRSMKNWSVTRTLPIRETRPVSLRPRSRSMSARPLLRIGQKLLARRLVLRRIRPPAPGCRRWGGS